ncbi:MAG: hypothetical protein HN389_04695 [Clostridia bacterium]|jgi:hypothetical protein|nr:hypothetical protein [Clostridia bacterium]
MYCKSCNKDYPKNTKLCKKCGIALVPGQAPIEEKGVNKKVFIIGGIVAVLVIAAFLLVGLLGMVPADVKGTWYEINGYDYEYEFLPFGKIEYSGHKETFTGTYMYDEETGTGIISSDEPDIEDREFTLDNATITMGPSIFTRKYVEQFTSESFIESIVDEIDSLEE